VNSSGHSRRELALESPVSTPVVESVARRRLEQSLKVSDLLAEQAEIGKHLDRPALARLCDPANYLGQSGVTGPGRRRPVLLHSPLSFVFNTAILVITNHVAASMF
jgi:hypothetical protein